MLTSNTKFIEITKQVPFKSNLIMIAEYIYELTITFQAQGIEVSTFLQILRDSQRNCTGNVWWNNCNLKGTKIREDKAD